MWLSFKKMARQKNLCCILVLFLLSLVNISSYWVITLPLTSIYIYRRIYIYSNRFLPWKIVSSHDYTCTRSGLLSRWSDHHWSWMNQHWHPSRATARTALMVINKSKQGNAAFFFLGGLEPSFTMMCFYHLFKKKTYSTLVSWNRTYQWANH